MNQIIAATVGDIRWQIPQGTHGSQPITIQGNRIIINGTVNVSTLARTVIYGTKVLVATKAPTYATYPNIYLDPITSFIPGHKIKAKITVISGEVTFTGTYHSFYIDLRNIENGNASTNPWQFSDGEEMVIDFQPQMIVMGIPKGEYNNLIIEFSMIDLDATDKTLSIENKPADAKAVGNVRDNLIFGKICSITDIGTAAWIQGTISNTGALDNSTTRCRSKSLVGCDSAAFIRIEIATGYEVSVIEYRDQKAIVANFVQRLVPFTANKIEFTPITGYMYRLVIRAIGEGDISPETIPDDCVHVYVYSVKTLKAEDLDFAVNTLKVLAADGDNELIDWEQGTLSITTGRPNAASNRVRSKLYATYNSLRYLYVYCPSDFKLAVRVYEQSDAATQVQTYNFKTGFYIVEHTEGTMYKFILKKIDETDLTPSDVPSDLVIIPVFNSHWSKKAHGESVATRTTKRSNPTYVSQIVSVAQSYYDHRNDMTSGRRDMVYGYDTAVRQDTYTNQIDCSAFVGLVLRGVLYTDTQYYTKVDTPAASVIANPDFVWSLNPQYYDYYSGDLTTEPDDATCASQLGEWMVDMGWRVPKDKHLLNLEVGDIIFYSRLNAQGTAIAQPDRFMSINHIAVVVDKVPTVQGDGYYEGGFKYKHTMMEVTNVTPCVQTQVVETGWDTPSAVNANNYNTLSLICRPDLGSI